ATAAAVIRADPAAVGLDDRLNNGQAKAQAILAARDGRLGAMEWLKQWRCAAGREPRPAIGNAHAHEIVFPRERNLDIGAARSILVRVEHQVDQRLPEAPAVGGDQYAILRRAEVVHVCSLLALR